jgi:hypothetical protein
MSDIQRDTPPAKPLERCNPGAATLAELVARRSDQLRDDEKQRLAETASREEDA